MDAFGQHWPTLDQFWPSLANLGRCLANLGRHFPGQLGTSSMCWPTCSPKAWGSTALRYSISVPGRGPCEFFQCRLMLCPSRVSKSPNFRRLRAEPGRDWAEPGSTSSRTCSATLGHPFGARWDRQGQLFGREHLLGNARLVSSSLPLPAPTEPPTQPKRRSRGPVSSSSSNP